MDLTWIENLDSDEEIMLLEPRSTFDRAIIGLVHQFNHRFVLYSQRKVIDALMDVDKMSYEDAQEWYCYNMAGAWVGHGTPAFLVTNDQDSDIAVKAPHEQ
jgi:hypothetical protein